MYDAEKVLPAYIRCALWSSMDESDESGGKPMDANYGPDNLADETLSTMRDEVEDFLQLIERERPGVSEAMARTLWADPGQVGHDFWLTRNGHGTGFWDRYYSDGPEAELGDFLSKWARSYGEVCLYIGDNGMIYQM